MPLNFPDEPRRGSGPSHKNSSAKCRCVTSSSLSHDRPILLSVVDTEEKLDSFMPILEQMVQQGLVVLSNVDVVKYTHNYKDGDRRQEART